MLVVCGGWIVKSVAGRARRARHSKEKDRTGQRSDRDRTGAGQGHTRPSLDFRWIYFGDIIVARTYLIARCALQAGPGKCHTGTARTLPESHDAANKKGRLLIA